MSTQLGSNNQFPKVILTEQGSTPSNPSSGDQKLWIRSSDHRPCLVNSSGTVTTVSRVVQVVNTQTGAVASGSTAIPADDTIPQNTEGDEFMTLSITPTSSSNVLKIDVVANLSNSNATRTIIAALFQDSTANALAASAQFQPTALGFVCIAFTHYMTAGTTSSTTFKVRAGSSNTTTFNGFSGGRTFGGAFASSITITEIAA